MSGHCRDARLGAPASGSGEAAGENLQAVSIEGDALRAPQRASSAAAREEGRRESYQSSSHPTSLP